MGLSEMLAMLRSSWRFMVVSVLLCVSASIYVTAKATPEYTTSARLYVSAQGTGSTLDQAYTGGLLSQQRVASYAAIVASDDVVSKVIQMDGSHRSLDSVEGRLSVSNPANTVLLDVGFTDPDPVVAQRTATDVAREFANYASALEVANGSHISQVRLSLVQPAKLPTQQISPKPRRNLALGLLAGIAIGLAGAVLRKGLDRSVRDIADLQQLGLPALGSVPEEKSARKNPLLGVKAVQTPRAEAFRQIRTNLMFLNIDEPVRSLVVTSAVAQEGKTSTTANLAITFAQAGMSVLVIDADLRRPKLAAYLGLEGAVGLTDVLIGKVRLDDALQPWQDGSVTLLPSGSLPLNPSELLNSQRAADLIADLASRYDIVFIDSPPLLPVTDAAILAAWTDGVILVTRAGRSRREHVRAAASALSSVDARINGVVLNRTHRRESDPYASYYKVAPSDERRRPFSRTAP